MISLIFLTKNPILTKYLRLASFMCKGNCHSFGIMLCRDPLSHFYCMHQCLQLYCRMWRSTYFHTYSIAVFCSSKQTLQLDCRHFLTFLSFFSAIAPSITSNSISLVTVCPCTDYLNFKRFLYREAVAILGKGCWHGNQVFLPSTA